MATADTTGIDRERAQALAAAEDARFVAERPRSMALQERARRSMPRGVPMAWMDDLYDHPPVWVAHGEGAHFTDVDGHTYLDLYVADMSAFCGHAPAPVTEAVARRMKLGNQFLLPGEDAIAVAEHLAGRYGLPKWQFTSSATQANTEVIRLAREMTGRQTVLLFDGKYHGEGDATLVVAQGGEVVAESRGLPPWITTQARVVAVNDVAAAQAALAPGDVALVLAEPAMTNVGFLLPQPGFHDALRRLTREAGTLLAIDETHSLVCSYAGLAREWGLAGLGERMAAGLRAAIGRAGLPWSVVAHGAHAFYFFVAEPPIDGAGSRAADDPDLRALIRVFMANRGVWESGWWLGPTLSVATAPTTWTATSRPSTTS